MIRLELEQELNQPLDEFKAYIDEEILHILGKPALHLNWVILKYDWLALTKTRPPLHSSKGDGLNNRKVNKKYAARHSDTRPLEQLTRTCMFESLCPIGSWLSNFSCGPAFCIL